MQLYNAGILMRGKLMAGKLMRFRSLIGGANDALAADPDRTLYIRIYGSDG